MNRITLTGDETPGATSVSNVFIDYYMKEANDAQIKVYLYLLRNVASNHSFEIGDIADEFNHTEKDVIRALKYWEKAGLLSIRYDEAGEIISVGLIPAAQTSREAASAVTAPVLSIVPVAEKKAVPEKKTVTKPAVPEKPSYGADDLRSFKMEPGTEELIAITESYLGKTISPADLRSLLYIHRELNFNFEMTDLLLQYCVSKNKKSFHYIESIAVSWYEQGIKTPAQAKDGISGYDRNVKDIMAALGKNAAPTIKESEFINRWLGTYAFPKEVILAACERTVMKTDTDRFPYAEGILARWNEQGLHTLAAVEASEEEYRRTKKSVPIRPVNDSRYNQYTRSKYDFAALEKFIKEN
ncbi:MAG: DnaD domain protein [Lachnospiraceae bacterium]|nr:DnaD domain protein [Lachnospiraceae bacterium]